MDIANIQVTEKRFEILHPSTKEGLNVFVTLMSPQDKRLDKLRNRITQISITNSAKNKVEKVEDIKKNRNDILFAAVTGWEWLGDANYNGEKPELTIRNFNNLIEELPWFLEQIDNQFTELESFFQPIVND